MAAPSARRREWRDHWAGAGGEPMEEDVLALEIARSMLAREGTGPAWGIQIMAAGVGHAKLAMEITSSMTNGHGSIHGGMIFALADTAFAYACNSRNVATVAQSASIIFLAPASVGETLIAEAEEEGARGRSGIYRVSVRTREDQRLIAQFQGHSRAIGGVVVDPAVSGAQPHRTTAK